MTLSKPRWDLSNLTKTPPNKKKSQISKTDPQCKETLKTTHVHPNLIGDSLRRNRSKANQSRGFESLTLAREVHQIPPSQNESRFLVCWMCASPGVWFLIGFMWVWKQNTCWNDPAKFLPGKIVLRHDRVVAILVLAVIHDAMKNTAWLPRVHHQHAPYCGHGAGDCIHDRDIALAYVIERFPQLLPSFDCLEPGQRAPILFAQVKMGFNNSWLVHGEAPPRVLFSKFKQVIMRGRVSQVDINFYFVHWFTHITGAVVHRGRPWHGVEKCATESSIRVLRRFVDSFGFVDRLASDSEVHVMEDYLSNRWEAHGLPFLSAKNTSTIALQRLTLMAQGFERDWSTPSRCFHLRIRFASQTSSPGLATRCNFSERPLQ